MSKPAVFSDLDHPSALRTAREQGKWLLVDATAAWCGPCKVMDRTSWVDPAVVNWITQHAIAIQVDVDAESETTKQLEIRAMPTVIAFRDGVEFDRSVGLKQPTELLSWLRGLLYGETALAKLRVEAAQQPGGMMPRMSLARALANAGKFDEATEEYAWLWQHMLEHEPAMLGVRVVHARRDFRFGRPSRPGPNEVLSPSRRRGTDARAPRCRSPGGLDALEPGSRRAAKDAGLV